MITIWHNKENDAPSIELGPVAIDLHEETTNQTTLFSLVMNSKDTVLDGNQVKALVTPEIAEFFNKVVAEEVAKLTTKPPKKKAPHVVEVEIQRNLSESV